MCAGAHGWISGVLNVATSAAKEMYRAVVHDNDAARGLRIWKRILPLVHLYTHQQIGPVSDLAMYRSILNLWQLQGGFSRAPFFPLNAEQEQKLRDVLERSGWLDPDQALAGI